jgi:hypothetical protein
MAPNLEHTVRALPGYSIGVQHGTDIGLVIALTVITAELTRQTTPPSSPRWTPRQHIDTARHQYCAARLADVAKVIGARFRQ